MKKSLILVALAAVASPSFADIAFNSFGPADSYDSGTGYNLGWANDYTVGMQFKSETTGFIDSVELACLTFASGTIRIEFYEDNAGIMGTQLTSLDTSLNSSGVITYTALSPAASLTQGNKYWLKVSPTDTSVVGLWMFTNLSQSGPAYLSNGSNPSGSYSTSHLTAFRVNTTAVPEPATTAILGLGALAALKRRKK